MIYCISNGTIRHGVQYLILKYIWPPIFVISPHPDWIDSSMMTIVRMIVKDLVMMIKDHDDYGLIWSQPVWLSKLWLPVIKNFLQSDQDRRQSLWSDFLIVWLFSDHLLEGLGPTLVILLVVLLLKLPFLDTTVISPSFLFNGWRYDKWRYDDMVRW